MSKRSLMLGLAVLLSACSDTAGPTEARARAEEAAPSTTSGVVARVMVICLPSTLYTGGTGSCFASAFDSNNNAIDGASFGWSSSNAGVVSVGPTGGIYGASPGTAAVSASAGGISGGTPVSVVAPPVATTLSITPAAPRVLIGATTQLTGVVRDQYGDPMPNAITWSSDHPAVATVNASGLVTGVGPGTTTIRAASGSLSAAVPLVSAPAVTVSGPMYAEDDTATVTVTALPSGSYHFTWAYNTCQVSGSCPSGYTALQAGQGLTSGSRYVSRYDTHVRFRIEVRATAGGSVLETLYHYVDGRGLPLPPGQGGCGTGLPPTPIWC